MYLIATPLQPLIATLTQSFDLSSLLQFCMCLPVKFLLTDCIPNGRNTLSHTHTLRLHFTRQTSDTFLRVARTAQSSYTPLHGDLPTSHPLDKILRERLAILQAPFVPS